MSKTILFVDDEVKILRALRRLFVDSGYIIHFAGNGKEAKAVLEQNAVDVIISDIKMSDMHGFDLLRYAKENYPSVTRVALSGYTDCNDVYSALDDNIAKMYIFKPWDNDELMDILKRLFELELVLEDKKLLKLFNNLDKLPSVPELYKKICKLIESDEDMKVISDTLEEDPAIASKILRVANSAYFGAKTGSIAQAIKYIGLANVKNIVLSNGVFDEMTTDPGMRMKIWNHVSLTNKLMNVIYEKCLDKKVPNMFASAGLLHDIGRIVISHFFEDQYVGLLEMFEEGIGDSLHQLEEEIIGVDHQLIGGYLLNWWDIPLPIVESAVYHHNPFDKNIINKEIVAVVHIANHFAWKTMGEATYATSLNRRVFEMLELKEDVLSVAEAFVNEHKREYA